MKPRILESNVTTRSLRRLQISIAVFVLASSAVHAQFVPLKPAAKTSPTTTIQGLVKDASGSPVSGAPVRAILGGEVIVQSLTAFTDDSGSFKFEDLHPGPWFISVDDERFARQWEYERGIEIPAPSAAMPLIIRLAAPQEFAGVVHDRRGAPVEGATVIMNFESLNGEESSVQGNASYNLQVVMTDANGGFVLTRLRPGTIGVVLEHPDFAQTRVYELKTGTVGSVLTIDDGITLSGTVTADGAPVPGVKVAVWTGNESHRQWGNWEATTAADGSFAVPHVPNLSRYGNLGGNIEVAAFFIRVNQAGWKSDNFRVYQYEENLLPSVPVVISHGDAEEYEPKFIDIGKRAPEGAVAEGAVRVVLCAASVASWDDVSVGLSSRSPRENGFSKFDEVDETGLAVFEHVPPGEYGVWTLTSKPIHFEPQLLAVRPNQITEIELKPGSASLRGRLVGATSTSGKRYLSWFLSDPPLDLPAQGGGRINEDGTYEIDGFTPGKYRLIYEGDGIMKNYFITTVAPGANWFDLALASSRIDGRLVGFKFEKKDTLGIGSIRLLPSNTTTMSGNLVGFTDADENGEFHFDNVPAGRYVVALSDSSIKQTLMTNVVVASNSSSVSVELSLPSRIGRIEGRVTNLELDDARLAKLFQSLSISAMPLSEYGYEFAQAYWTSVDAETGHYVFDNLPEGLYGLLLGSPLPAMWTPGVEVRHGLANMRDITLPESRKVNIRLDRGGLRTPKAIWSLRMADQTHIKYDYFVGSGPEGTSTPTTDFLLVCGEYTIEADFGDGVRAELPITVEAGEGVQEFVVYHPALKETAAAH